MMTLIVGAVWIGIPSYAPGFGERDHVNMPSDVPVLPVGIDGNFDELRGQSRIPIGGPQRSADAKFGTWFPTRTKSCGNICMPIDVDLFPRPLSTRHPNEIYRRASNRSGKECGFVEHDVRGPDVYLAPGRLRKNPADQMIVLGSGQLHHAEIVLSDALRPLVSHSSAPITRNLFKMGLSRWSLGIIDGTSSLVKSTKDNGPVSASEPLGITYGGEYDPTVQCRDLAIGVVWRHSDWPGERHRRQLAHNDPAVGGHCELILGAVDDDNRPGQDLGARRIRHERDKDEHAPSHAVLSTFRTAASSPPAAPPSPSTARAFIWVSMGRMPLCSPIVCTIERELVRQRPRWSAGWGRAGEG